MSLTLAQLRARTYDRLRETSADSHFSDSQINSYLNEAQDYIAAMGSPPDKNNLSAPIPVTINTGDYTNPSDDLYLQQAYFGTTTNSSDVFPLRIVTKEIMKDLFPNWMDATIAAAGTPKYIFRKDFNTLSLFPRPDSTNAGKNIYLFYGDVPTDMVSDIDTPSVASPFHNCLPFYACRLAYYALTNPTMAKEMFSAFMTDYNAIKDNVNKEAEEVFRFKWGISET